MKLTREQIEAFRHEHTTTGHSDGGGELEPWAIEENAILNALCDLWIAQQTEANKQDSRLRALLEGLECEQIDTLMTKASPDLFRAVGAEIAKAAKLGSHSYVNEQPK